MARVLMPDPEAVVAADADLLIVWDGRRRGEAERLVMEGGGPVLEIPTTRLAHAARAIRAIAEAVDLAEAGERLAGTLPDDGGRRRRSSSVAGRLSFRSRSPSVEEPSMKRIAGLILALTLLSVAPAVGQEEDALPLEGLVVTASPTPRPADAIATHVTVLDAAELRGQGMARVQDALRTVPGVSVVQNGSTGAATSVFMRGGESDYVLVLVDGVQVNQPGGSFDFSALTLDNVERIEIVRGPASALYGSDAVAGVIHVITRSGGDGLRGSVSARGGSYGRLDWSAGLRGGTPRAGYALSLGRVSTDGILAFNNAHANTVLSGSFHVRPDEATRARLSVRVGDREYHFPTDGSGRVVDRNAFTFGDRTTVSLSATRRLTERMDVQTLLGLSETDGGTDDAPDGPADTLGFYGFTSLDHVRRATADVRLNLRLGGGVVTAGWELEEERQRSFTESLSQFGPSAGRSRNDRWNRAYYAHVTGAEGHVAFNAGGRLEDNERFGSLATWQAGTAWRPGGGPLRLRASVGRAIKEPTFFENFATGFARGNPDLDPERATSWEVGADQELVGGRVLVRGTYFDQAYRDLIQFTASPPGPDDPSFFNVAAADSRGLEVSVEAVLPALRGGVSWTWLDTEVADAGLDEGPGAAYVAGERLLRRPAHTVGLRLSRSFGARASVSAAVDRVGSRQDRDFSTFPAERVALEAYTAVSLGAEVTVLEPAGGPALTLTFRGENLLDEAFEEVVGFRAPGRAIYLGGRLDFGPGD